MNLNLQSRSEIEKEIVGALKSAIHAHGPVTLKNTNHAAKRIRRALGGLAKRQRDKRLGDLHESDFWQIIKDEYDKLSWQSFIGEKRYSVMVGELRRAVCQRCSLSFSTFNYLLGELYRTRYLELELCGAPPHRMKKRESIVVDGTRYLYVLIHEAT